LALIRQLDLPARTLQTAIWVTDAVWEEVAGDPAWRGARDIIEAERQGLLHRTEAGGPETFPGLDPGESTVITAAAERGAWVIIDDVRARLRIERDPRLSTAIPTRFTLVSLMVAAQQYGLVPSVRALLDELRSKGYGIDQPVYNTALRLTDEDDLPG
jgi:predicted nucleic acid-binding protein